MLVQNLPLLPRRVLIAVVRAYRLLLSPWLGNACRFEPTCSAYALQALEHYGAAAGSYLVACRLARCHPWCAAGYDPVPEHFQGPFTRLLGAGVARQGRTESPLSSLPDKKLP